MSSERVPDALIQIERSLRPIAAAVNSLADDDDQATPAVVAADAAFNVLLSCALGDLRAARTNAVYLLNLLPKDAL